MAKQQHQPVTKKVTAGIMPLEDTIFQYEVKGSMIVALFNALHFTLAHREEYAAEIEECATCIEAMTVMRQELANIINVPEMHDITHLH